MRCLKKLIERLKRFFETDLNLESCLDDFEHYDRIVEIKLESLKSDYKFQINQEELKKHQKEENEIQKENEIDLMLETLNVKFSKIVASLIKFSRTYALLYCFKKEQLTIGDIKHIYNKLLEIDEILKYEILKLFNLKNVKILWINNDFVYSEHMNSEDKREFEVMKEIIRQNKHITNAVKNATFLNGLQICCEFQVKEIRKMNFNFLTLKK